MGITQRKNVTRATRVNTIITVKPAKPRNAIIRAASVGQVKLGTVKHQKSKSAVRQAEKIATKKVIDAALKD